MPKKGKAGGSSPPVNRTRVTWPAGDPNWEIKRWADDAALYLNLKKKWKSALLVRKLQGYLNKEFGYAWPKTEDLRVELGDKHISATERDLKTADDLGVIERERLPIFATDGSGKFVRNWRKIYPTRTAQMESEITAFKMRAKPNPENKRNNVNKTDGYKVRKAFKPSVETTISKPLDTEPLVQENRTPNRTPTGSGTNRDHRTPYDKKGLSREAHQIQSDKPSVSSPDARRLMQSISMIGPLSEVDHLLPLGRSLWQSVKTNSVSASDSSILLSQIKDAALRSWLEVDPRIVAMLSHLDRLHGQVAA